MPECTFTISGKIRDFSRLDNIYKALLREASKLLTDWEISAAVKYSEKKGKAEQK